ncbi:MAG: N-formylglutamate amidohydrolase [Planctomycetes bacterium]|nr:N-formylglutamate amidohydrolase [Planctomycetota bacterium]
MPIAAVISTPHCSADLPPELAPVFAADHARLLKQGDPFTDQVFALPDVVRHVKARYSRFVCDLNRARERRSPTNGVATLVDFDNQRLYRQGYNLNEEEIQRRLSLYYDPFYAELAQALARPETLFFIDGHSMDAVGPKNGKNPGQPRPDFAIGTRGTETGDLRPEAFPLSLSPEIARFVRARLETIVADQGWSVALNTPFFGDNVTRFSSDPARPGARPGFQLEVNRRLYLEADNLTPRPDAIALLRDRLAIFAREIETHLRATLPPRKP